MKSILLVSAVFVGLMSPAHAALITAAQVSTSTTLPSFGSIIVPTPVGGFVGGVGHSTASVTGGSGAVIARSPFEGVSGYTNANFDYVLGGSSATFTSASNPTFVTGGDTFSFIFGSPDDYNSIAFSNGDVLTGSAITNAFASTGSGYYVTTISGLGSYDSVTFSSTSDAVEFATFNVSSVPLPASLPLFGTALLGLGVFAFAKKKAKKSAASA